VQPINEISRLVIGEAITIHRDLGPGLLESVYETVLEAALVRKGMAVARQVPIDIEYDGMRFEQAFRIDLLVDARLVLEIKSVERLGKAHSKQLLTYLRLTKQPVGLLMNFSEATMMDGIVRLVNDYRPES
jgi:iron complex transport system substrate-binding protein